MLDARRRTRRDVIVIVGLGIDLIENRRVEQELARGEWVREDGIFSREEIRYCSMGKKPALRYAACFAAKEAALKALGAGVGDLAIFREVEVKAGGSGHGIVVHHRLQSDARRLGVRRINLSIAATKRQTGAMVILES
jgi:holo-[acyl-carrier protein] synthase